MKEKQGVKLHDLLEQIAHLMQTIQNHKGPIHMTPDLASDIEVLKGAVSNLKEGNRAITEELDINPKELRKKLLSSDGIRSSEKQLLKQVKDIEIEAHVMNLACKKAKEKKRKNSVAGKDPEEKRQIKERKKIFKTIGGDKKWLHL